MLGRATARRCIHTNVGAAVPLVWVIFDVFVFFSGGVCGVLSGPDWEACMGDSSKNHQDVFVCFHVVSVECFLG